MPALGALLGGVDFTKLSYAIPSMTGAPVVVEYGKFVQVTFDFVIIALVLFMAISALNKLKKPAPAAGPAPVPADIALLTEIRDALAPKKAASAPAKKAKK
jgi:large conductance mechanosensitive channel